MEMARTRTQKFKRLTIGLWIADAVLCFGPLLYYFIMAFIRSGIIESKFALVSSISVAAILTGISILRKSIPKSLPWVAMIALWLVLDNLIPVIWVFAITQVLDEFIVVPMKQYAQRVWLTNKEYDKREKAI